MYLFQEFVMKWSRSMHVRHLEQDIMHCKYSINVSQYHLVPPCNSKSKSIYVSSVSPPSLFFLFYQGFCSFDYPFSLCWGYVSLPFYRIIWQLPKSPCIIPPAIVPVTSPLHNPVESHLLAWFILLYS